MDATFIDAVKNHGPATATALAAFWIIRQLLSGFAAALVDQRQAFTTALDRQREDFLAEIKDIRANCQNRTPTAPKIAGFLALACLSQLLGGCAYAQFKHASLEAKVIRVGFDTSIRDLHARTALGDILDVGSIDEQAKMLDIVNGIVALARGSSAATVTVQQPAPPAPPATQPTPSKGASTRPSSP